MPETRRQHSRSRRATVPSSERAYRELKRAILSGEFAPRTRMVEVALAQRLGVSRTPIREALKRLLAEGHLSRDPLGGLVVHAVTQQEIEDAYFVCGGLDGLAAHLAAYRISPQGVTRLRTLHMRMTRALDAGRTEEAAAANLAFHDAIYDIAGNRMLAELARGLRDFVQRFSAETLMAVPGRARQVVEEHGAVLTAIEKGDAAAAERAARRHLHESRLHLTELRVTSELLSSLEN